MIYSLLVIGSSLSAAFAANQFLAKSLGSNMVLQQNSVTSLYGFSEKASNEITVHFNGKEYTGTSATTESNDGGYFWKVNLPATAGGFTKHWMKVSSASRESALLTNVVFGEVYLCSGQSNMQFGIPELESTEVSSIIADAPNYPNLRFMSVLQDTCTPQVTEPLDDLYTVNVVWSESSADSVNHSWGTSAVCYLYGKYLYNDILKGTTPVGLVMSSWGGTPVKAWSPESVYDKCMTTTSASTTTAAKVVDSTVSVASRSSSSGGDCTFDPTQKTSLYNTMIVPFKDMIFKGALWYQGEQGCYGASYYPCMQDGMVTAWRELFGYDLPFMFTQLATWNQGGNSIISSFRAGQDSILGITSNVAMVTAADLGDPESPHGEIHPRKKDEIGRRMSLAASTLIYGTTKAHMGPRMQNATVLSDETLGYKVRVSFDDFSSVGLNLQPAQECPSTSADVIGGCAGALFIFSDYSEVQATPVIVASGIVDFVPVSAISKSPAQLSYGQADYPMLTVYNGEGTPMLPFIKDLTV